MQCQQPALIDHDAGLGDALECHRLLRQRFAKRLALIGAPALTQAYRASLGLAGLAARPLDATAMTRAGLAAAHARLQTERTRP